MKKITSTRNLKLSIFVCLLAVSFTAFNNNKAVYDATGTFEATETIVPAEANGVIKSFNIQKGETLDSGQQIGYIDTVQLFLKKRQLEAQIKRWATDFLI